MGDWKLRSLDDLDSWDDSQREQAIKNVRERIDEGRKPSIHNLTLLAQSMLWMERWNEDHRDEDDSDEEELDGEDDEDEADELDQEADIQTSEAEDDFDDSAYFSEDGNNSSVLDTTESDTDSNGSSPTPTLPEADIPSYNRHYRPYKALSPQQISQALRTKLTQPLTSTEVSRRTVYGFRETAASPYLKIGYTKNFEDRRGALFRECGIRCEDIAFRLETRHAGKVERLVQRHLAAERRTEDASAFEGEKRCSHQTHIEWFEVCNKRAAEVVEGWVRFMELEPFGEDVYGEAWGLKHEWRRRLADVEGGAEEGDRWLRWLERYAPDPAIRADIEMEETPILQTQPEEMADEDMEVEGASDSVDIVSPTTDDNIPSQPHLPARHDQIYAVYYNTTPTPPCLSPTTSELLQPNLLTRLLFYLLQIFLFLAVVGNISYQQYTCIALLGISTLAFRRGNGVVLDENRKHDMELLPGVWYPDLSEQVATMDEMDVV
ncbi:hypothetical protein V495_06794 [Pseudogymnoascus sp. VKM F-4514 (FW-929)]|nr:hypothetical protein V495_06794 [Pseudogymnoascus sp. VKM F-4514 (FW-929)]KFY54152.1 hypothetical protein V497_07956 [Pseudogymnoascus sp. VKM F-4516 (FW-969)]